MPSSVLRRSAHNTPISGYPGLLPSYRRPEPLLTPWSTCAIGDPLAGLASGTLASGTTGANRAVLVPFQLAHEFTVMKVFWANGATVGTDNVDVGVYTEAGVKKFTSGAVLSAGASIVQEVDVTDFLLTPGRYWLALSMSGNTATVQQSVLSAELLRMTGVAYMSAAHVLPASITPANTGDQYVPLFGIAERTQVA